MKRLSDVGGFSTMGKLDPIDKLRTVRKRTDLVLGKAGLLIEADGRYDFTGTMSFPDHVGVKIIAISPIVHVQWQSGPDAVYRDLMFRGGQTVRNATVVPGTFDYWMTIGFLNNIQPEFNGFFPATSSVAPVGLSVSTDLTLFVQPECINLLPFPFELNQPDNGFAWQIQVHAPDLQQLAVPATIIDFWARVSFWFELQR